MSERNLRKDLQLGMVYTMAKKLGYTSIEGQDKDDFLHDVYARCLSKEASYNKSDVTLPSFVATMIRNMAWERYKTKKETAKSTSQFVPWDEVYDAGYTPCIEEQVLLEELKPFLCRELCYTLANPWSTGYTSLAGGGMKVTRQPFMTNELVGEIVGIHRNTVHQRIEKNRKQLKEMI